MTTKIYSEGKPENRPPECHLLVDGTCPNLKLKAEGPHVEQWICYTCERLEQRED